MFQLNLSQICLKILTTSHSSVEIVGNKCAVDGVRFQGEQNMTIRRAIIQRNESRTTLVTGYHVSAAKNHVSSEKPKELNCICFHSSSMLHNTLEWKSNVNFKCSSKLQFQGNCFHTNNVANITLPEQKTTLLKSSE